MKIYLAPMEGVTGYIYRNIYHEFFNHVEKYFTPFLKPHTKRDFTTKEKNEIDPENNKDMYVVPQILTNNAEAFVNTALKLKNYGYDEVNLNLGCPSKTVVSKNRGSGFLSQTKQLNDFLDSIFTRLDMKISIKTRIGKTSPDEFYDLLEIFNRFPAKELIIHPRLQTDYYRNTPNWDIFSWACRESKIPVCYNGNIFTLDDYRQFEQAFPEVGAVMLGRGLIANPALAQDILKHKSHLTVEALRMFHDRLYSEFQKSLSGDIHVLFRMKELWSYMGSLFAESERCRKKIWKSQTLSEYETAVGNLFREHEFIEGAGYTSVR